MYYTQFILSTWLFFSRHNFCWYLTSRARHFLLYIRGRKCSIIKRHFFIGSSACWWIQIDSGATTSASATRSTSPTTSTTGTTSTYKGRETCFKKFKFQVVLISIIIYKIQGRLFSKIVKTFPEYAQKFHKLFRIFLMEF